MGDQSRAVNSGSAHFGGGFTGLSAAHFAYIKNPSLRIAVVDQQSYGQSMASTRNAGFACFGSPTEILTDIENEGIEQALARVKLRYEGIQLWLEMFSAKGSASQVKPARTQESSMPVCLRACKANP